MKKECTTVTIRIPKETLKKIDEIVDNGSFTDTRTSVLNKMIEKEINRIEK